MPKMTVWAIVAAIVSINALATLALPASVAAHAALARSEPGAGETLPEPPADIRIEFTEPLETTFTGADLLDGSGAALQGVSVSISPQNDRELVILPPVELADGNYTVAWRTLSAADGHTLQGYFGFRVGSGAAGELVVAAPEAAGKEAARALTRGLALLGLAALLAIAPVTLMVLDPATRATGRLGGAIAPFLRRYSLLAAALALLGSLAALGAQAASVAPDSSLPAAIGQTLANTRYGDLWLLRLAMLLLVIGTVAIAFWGRREWRRTALGIGAILAAVLPVSFSLTSHAAAQQEGRAAAIAADALHLLAASLWAGGLFLLVLVLLPAIRQLPANERRAALRVAIPRFSVIGLTAWGVLALTGLYAAWLQVGTIDALRETPYGQSLLLKGALLIPILALAVFHLVLGKGVVTDRGAGGFAKTVVVEALIVVAVLLVVGRLIGLEPAREVLAGRTPPEIMAALTFTTDEGERSARLTISPGAAGVNTFTLDIDGSPLPDESEGVLRFALPNQEIGAQELRLPAIEPNRFQAEGPELALPGEWRIDAIVRAIGTFSWATEIVIPVGQTPPPSPAPNPAPLFAPAAIVGMIAIAIGAAGLAVSAAGRGALLPRRAAIAVAGAIAVATGAAILSSSRIPAPDLAPEPILAQAALASVASPSGEDGHQAMMDHHATPMAGGAPPEALPGPGATVSGDGFTAMIATSPRSAEPVDVTVTLRAADGSPLTEARVVVLSDMPEMAMGRMETPAVETQPGEYVAEFVPLGMSGQWRLAVRVSPQGASTQVFSFAVDVP